MLQNNLFSLQFQISHNFPKSTENPLKTLFYLPVNTQIPQTGLFWQIKINSIKVYFHLMPIALSPLQQIISLKLPP
jgi:hypothetical protein